MCTLPAVTFVVPVYNERDTLAPLAEGIARHAAPWQHTILFIDDGSTDGSSEEIRRLQECMPSVGFIRFARNAGKTQALAAGFAHADGDIIVTMDADLQDDPAEIPRLLAKLEEGYDLVCGWKADRHDPWHKTLPSKVYNGYIARTFGLRLHDVNTGFKAMRADVTDTVPLFADMHRLIPIFACRAGRRVTEIPVKHHPRRHGESKYGPERFLHGLRDIARARLLTRFHGSVAPYARRAAFWSALTLGGAFLLLPHWPKGAIPGPGPAWLPPLLPFLIGGPIVAHCLYMVAVGPGIVRRARDKALRAEIAETRLPEPTA